MAVNLEMNITGILNIILHKLGIRNCTYVQLRYNTDINSDINDVSSYIFLDGMGK